MSISKDGKVNLEKEFYGEKTCLIAKSGYGKSYTARVIIEEGVEKGQTFIIIDPQDAYLNLPDFEYISANDVKSTKGLAILLAQTNRNTVITTKRLSIEHQNRFMHTFLTEFRRHIRKGIQTIVIDEIHKFAPEGNKTESKQVVMGMFQENRSDGLGCIAISQRISRVDKTVLSQSDHLGIGKVSSFRDKQAVKNYIENPDDVEKIAKLEKGEFYLAGFGLAEPEILMIRKSKTEHSGNSPQNLITQDTTTYNHYKKNFVKRGNKTMDKIQTSGEPIAKVIPSAEGAMDMVKLGGKMGLGMAVGGLSATLIGSRFRSPISMISSRTLAGVMTTIPLYTGYRMIKQNTIKEMFKFGGAGSAAFTAGSLLFDIVALTKFPIPRILGFAISTATGATPAAGASNSGGDAGVDTDTKFA